MKLFEGLKVVECASVLAGPQAGTFFSELGARVIKFENSKTNGDVIRTWHTPAEDKESLASYYCAVNYKKEVRLRDLTLPEHHSELFAELADADILLSNFKYGDAEKLGLQDDFLRKQFPQLIHGKISGFEFDVKRVAFDVVLQAESGFMYMNGQPDSPPTKMPVALIDVLASHQLKEGILCALLERERGKGGSVVHVSLEKAALASLMNQGSYFLMTGKNPQRLGSLHPNIAPYGEQFQTGDGKMVVLAIGSNDQFRKLCRSLSMEEIASHENFATNAARVVHRTELANKLQEGISKYTFDTLEKEWKASQIPYGRIRTMEEVAETACAQASVLTEEIDGTTTKRFASAAFHLRH